MEEDNGQDAAIDPDDVMDRSRNVFGVTSFLNGSDKEPTGMEPYILFWTDSCDACKHCKYVEHRFEFFDLGLDRQYTFGHIFTNVYVTFLMKWNLTQSDDPQFLVLFGEFGVFSSPKENNIKIKHCLNRKEGEKDKDKCHFIE